MFRRRPLLSIASLLLAIAAGGALAIATPLLRGTGQFLAVSGEARVRYEAGAEANAAVIARALPEAIAAIERAQLRPFAQPVTVWVCASERSFERYGLGVRGAGGFVLNGRLFISPKPQNTAERLPRLLTHELSHLHLEQRLGLLRFARELPAWFKEGLAVHVSGSGAENVSEAEGRTAILRGQIFRRHERGSLLRPQTAAREAMPAHLFYRESAMFVAYLARCDATAFARVLDDVQERRALADSVRAAYGRELTVLWEEFVAGLKAAPAT